MPKRGLSEMSISSQTSPNLRKQIADRSHIFFRCVEGCNEPIMITDTNGSMIYVNPAWSQVYGYTCSEAVGQTPRLLRSKHQGDDFYREMWKQIQNPEIGHFKGELINQSKDGREVRVLLNITPYRDEQGQTEGYMGVALDLSEKIELEARLAQQDRLVTIGELTSGLAHEIGTPIGVIRGRAELLQMDSGLPAAVQKALEIIIRQTDRISTLISTLLRFSRSGATSLEVRPTSLDRVVSDVLNLLEEKLRRKHVVIEKEIPSNLTVMGDATKLEQILINLFQNSLHAFESRDPKLPPPRLGVRAHQDKKQVRILIEDNGPGIPPDIHDRIFLPFFTTKAAGQGTGLGLSIVSRLAHEMRGHIRLDREFNSGARFIVSLEPGH